MKKFLHLMGGLWLEQPSAFSHRLSVMARHVRAISRLKPKTYQLSAIGSQLSDTDRYVPAISNLIPKAHHLIPFLFLVFVSCGAALAQEPVGHTAPVAQAENKAIDLTSLGIQIGEKVPDITINNIHNYKSSAARLSDFKGKLLILDFWATWCGACINMIPKMDSLQKEFGDKVQFLSVTYQKEEEVLPFLEKLEKRDGRNYELSIATSDQALRGLFPHRYLPHYVWIEQNGIVKAITGYEEINAKQIELSLGQSFVSSQKRDLLLDYDHNIPLFVNGNAGNGQELYYRSTLTKYIPGLNSGYHTPKKFDQSKVKLTATNLTIPGLFSIAFGAGTNTFRDNNTSIEASDIDELERFFFDKPSPEWKENNAYCYEIILPLVEADRLYSYMQQDLLRIFNRYDVRIEKRPTKSLVLVRTSNDDKIQTRGGEVINDFRIDGFRMTNQPIKQFVGYLNFYTFQTSSMPLIDETDYADFIDLDLSADMRSIEEINKALAEYDLKFVEKIASVDILVIKERSKN